MAAPLRKRFIQSKFSHFVLSHFAAGLMRLIYLTCRVTRAMPAALEPYRRGEKQAIFVFWHGRLIMQPFLKPPGEMVVLISQHNDGALITTTMKRFGIGAVRGSKSRGSREAVRGLMEATGRRANIAITPDGPRGPFQVAAPGAIYVAMRTGYPIIPLAFSASRHWRLRSWDRFMIPKPFSHITFVAGEPYALPAELAPDALETAVASLNARLNASTASADDACGVPA